RARRRHRARPGRGPLHQRTRRAQRVVGHLGRRHPDPLGRPDDTRGRPRHAALRHRRQSGGDQVAAAVPGCGLDRGRGLHHEPLALRPQGLRADRHGGRQLQPIWQGQRLSRIGCGQRSLRCGSAVRRARVGQLFAHAPPPRQCREHLVDPWVRPACHRNA
ncbi:hypothetical protein LTR94_032278, partial [Friedmanniomyces endolithicus]